MSPPKAYSSFFFPHVSPVDTFRGRSFLSFDNADSLKEDDERSVFTSTATTISSFFPGSASSSSSSRKLASRSSSHPSLRPIPQPKPAPRSIPPVPPPYSAPAHRTEYQHLPARPFTSPSKPRRKPVPLAPPCPPPQPRRMSTSTVSTGYRNTTRAKALASLEGRRANTIPLNARSFMPLSDTDDEDEEEEEVDVACERVSRHRPRTIDSWFVGPPPSPSLSAVPSFLTNDSDESFDSPRPSMSSSSQNDFVDFEDIADPYEYDAWEVVGEKRPHWLKDVLE